MRSVFDKLKGRSLDELRVRSAQKIAAFLERGGWSEQAAVPSDAALFTRMEDESTSLCAESLLEQFVTRSSPVFFASFSDREKTRAALRIRFEHNAQRVIERAAGILDGCFDLLGLRQLSFGDPINWHLEPVSGKQAPRSHWSKINYLDVDVVGDKKVIWELNRHQHFLTLGRAYWYTGDERYAETFIAHINAWIDQNPPKIGINWASNLEVSFRAITWLWSLYFFKNSRHMTPAIFLRILKLLYVHARHLETYLSVYFSPNTHLTGEALGLFYLGTLLPKFKAAGNWRDVGKNILVSELDRQIRSDGVYFEQSSYYHRYTAEFYMHFLILLRANGQPVGSLVEEKLVKLLDHLMCITRPDGTTPYFGDDDGGRLVMLDERAANDFRPVLSTGAALFSRPDYKYVSGGLSEETVWLLGPDSAQASDNLDAQPPPFTSRAFPAGGYYVMRDGWGTDSNYLLMDCGPHGALNCGHAHADALAIDLAAYGRTLLVDPGTYTYTGSKELRDLFRRSAAHNTLTIDDESSSVPAGPFGWKEKALASVRIWASCGRYDFLEGEHDGFARLPAPAIHTRSVFFLKNDYWVVRDRVATESVHSFDIHLHFAPGAAPVISHGASAGVRERMARAAGLEIFTFSKGGRWKCEDGWVSRCYGERTAAPVCTFSKVGEGAVEFITFLIPRHATDPNCSVSEIEASSGRAFEVRALGRPERDFLVIGHDALVQTAGIVMDGALAWLRYGPSEGALREMVLRAGRSLQINGQIIFQAAKPVDLFARRMGGDLIIEAGADSEFHIAPFGAGRVIANNKVFVVKASELFKAVVV